MRSVVLRTLVEACENMTALRSLACWQGQGQRSLPSLLLMLWKEEEEEIGVARGEDATIKGGAYFWRL